MPNLAPWCLTIALCGCVTASTHQQVVSERDAAQGELARLKATVAAEEQRARQPKQATGMVPVVVAAVDMAENTVVSMENISKRSIPEQFVTSSVVKPDSASYIVNQRLLVPVQAGDMLLWSQFDTTRAAERVSTDVLRGLRLITLDVVKDNAVGGLVRPGDHVDVIAILKDEKTGERRAQTIAENLEVVATGKMTRRTNLNLLPENERPYANVTVMVTGEVAERLALAQELSMLVLSLRNPEDHTLLDPHPWATPQTLRETPSGKPGPAKK